MVEAYLEQHARTFVGTFDANCYHLPLAVHDLFDVPSTAGRWRDGLARIRAAETLVVGVETDFLFPLEQQEEIAMLLARRAAPSARGPCPRSRARLVPGGLDRLSGHRGFPGARPLI